MKQAIALTFVLLFLLSTPVWAEGVPATLAVQATVVATCIVSVAVPAGMTYIAVSQAFTLRCTRGTVAAVIDTAFLHADTVVITVYF